MPRLPEPGSDSGTWGSILNEFLSQSHNNDGALKNGIVTSNALASNSVTTAKLQDSAVTEAKLDTAVAAKLNAVAGQQGPIGPVGPEGPEGPEGPQGPAGATTIAGISGLQSALDGKASNTHTHATSDITNFTSQVSGVIGSKLVAGSNITLNYSAGSGETTISSSGGGGGGAVSTVAGRTGDVVLSASDIASGSFDISRIPTGTSSTTVALGNHTHSGYAATSHTHATADVTGTFTLAAAAPGAVFRCLWNGSAWTYNGVALSARPSSRTDIFFEYVGAPAATADPAWILPGDTRMDV